ncbi:MULTISPECIES: hypothetical protein [unclassified Streptomyces]|uniref:hypothetical protein n=1 Tax=unclassified Streptomyces TaxID=2593676 RepID=UPI002E17009A|nr:MULTISPECIES: hypothetical protein [unclassified Streptomyces]
MTRDTVATLCRALDGLPVAIELAAAQLRTHNLNQLVELVDHGQCWLSAPHPKHRRHQRLNGTHGATWRLCTPHLRRTWSRASVLAGPFTEQAAVLLCQSGDLPAHHIPAVLTQLAALGVLEHDDVDNAHALHRPRYRMTSAVRELGTRCLTEAGERDIAIDRQAGHCQQIAQVAENLWNNGCQTQAIHLLADEHHNLTTMLGHALNDPGPYTATAALETALRVWFWWDQYQPATGLRYFLQLLTWCPADHPVTPTATWLTAWLAVHNTPETARTLLARIWPQAVLDGNTSLLAHIAHVDGLLALAHHDLPRATTRLHLATTLIPDHTTSGPNRARCLADLALAQTRTHPLTCAPQIHIALQALATSLHNGTPATHTRNRPGPVPAITPLPTAAPANHSRPVRNSVPDTANPPPLPHAQVG